MRTLLLAYVFASVSACTLGPEIPSIPEHAFPQYGLSQGPDGWYFTRQDAAWGTSADQHIIRIDPETGALTRPSWSDPKASQSDFYFSPANGLACYITNRPMPTTIEYADPNIWCLQWSETGWQSPYPLPAPINDNHREWSPVIRSGRTVYFASDRPGGQGMGDLYRAKQDETGLWYVQALPTTINSPGGEWNLDVSPDGGHLIFEASHRQTNRTVPGDLYLSEWSDESGWRAATPLSQFNTDGSDLIPRFIGPHQFIFTTVEHGITRMRRGEIPGS